MASWREMNEQHDYLVSACNLLKCKPGELSSKIDKLLLKTEEIDNQILDIQAYLDIMEFIGGRKYYRSEGF